MDSNISRERIEEAKQKLGDAQADMIADLLKMEKYNPQRRIGCCPNPAHKDDTPSCSYNPRAHNFYCFGCSQTYDLIDAYMTTGLTFLQAVDKLFEAADIPHNFSYRGRPSDRDYKYPKPEWAETKEHVYAYWQKRCISPATIDALGIMEDKRGNTCFPYYDDSDVLRCVKVRPSRAIRKGVDKQKCWWMPGDTMHLLFNQNRINVSQPLIICCGEGDCAAIYEAGCQNVVSIPMGDGSTQWVTENWEWLEGFETFVLVHDNDEPGRKWKAEITRRLGEYRCKVVDLPETWTDDQGEQHHLKDANEALFWGGKQMLADAIRNAKEQRIESVEDCSDVTGFNMEQVDGATTGIAPLDALISKAYVGTVNIVTGVAGSGKSSFLSTIINQSIEQGFNTWVFSGELANPLLKNWVTTVCAGQGNLLCEQKNGHTAYFIKPEAAKQMNDYYRGRLYFYKDTELPQVDRLLASIEASVKRFDCRTIVLDNLMCIDLEATDDNKWNRQDAAIRSLVELARRLDVAMWIVIHPRKLNGEVKMLQLGDLSGVASSANLAHRVFSLYRVQDSDRVPGRNGKLLPYAAADVVLSVIKNRFGDTGHPIPLLYDPASRRFYSSPDDLEFRYAWDRHGTTDNLQYFNRDKYERLVSGESEPF